MNDSTLDSKKQLILDQEQAVANKLARRVLERPTPPIWMIFIPVFFVFHAWRIKQYGASLKVFAENHLKSRRLALDASACAVANGEAVDIEAILATVTDLPSQAREPFRRWLTLLIEHYTLLLTSPGATYALLLRNAYRQLITAHRTGERLARAEQELRFAVLETLDGDSGQLRKVVEHIGQQVEALRRDEIGEAFS